MAQYGKPDYWDDRFTRYKLKIYLKNRDPEPFDWYQRYSGLQEIIRQEVKETDNILVVGCGNSSIFFLIVFFRII